MRKQLLGQLSGLPMPLSLPVFMMHKGMPIIGGQLRRRLWQVAQPNSTCKQPY